MSEPRLPEPAPPPRLRPGLRLSDKVSFPPALPISARVIDLANAIAAHQVIIVAGETGSGKTTQLPKLCLAMGRGAHGYIGCTQPRRLAATSVAARVAEELDTPLGQVVGYKVRFQDQLDDGAWIKFMTDGVLLAEIHSDPELRRYDTLIIDEAHERSLNIDFLLGWVKQLLPRRPELRVIISSATLSTERFSAFFGDAPVVEVSGRTFPVEVLYRPPGDDEDDLADTIANTVEEITELDPRGDILVFLPGEREIREAAAALEQHALPHTVILPLYARLSAADQRRVFQTLPQRRVVLATNVAETSLTIPGIVYVVDSGVARINRYSVRTGVTQLLVEPVSKASADQRKGRCGRTASGVCFRLYEQQDYDTRPAYTDPEIRRVGLAGAILRMKSLGLGDVASFPFLDPPPRRAIDEGHRVLEELGALDEHDQLTDVGHQLARLPLDPRLGRMILGGKDEGALREVLVVAAVLGLQDPRERPLGAQQKADEAQRRFRDEGSDFAGLLKLWDFWREVRSAGKGKVSKACRDHFLSYPRMREWEDIHDQLVKVARELGLHPDARPAGVEQLHRALLPGLLSRIGMWKQEARAYVGARQTRFVLHPSSALARKPPPWVMAAELVETSQLFARTVAKIDPAWLERAGGALCKRSHGDPHWEQKQGQVMAREHVTLFGLPVASRTVAYGPIDPAASRDLFITHALVRHEYVTKGRFMEHNRRLLDQVHQLRAKARKSDMVADEYALAAFFEQRLPPGVWSGKTFEAWRKEAEARDPDILALSLDDVLLDERHELTPERFPDQIVVRGVTLPVRYVFDPVADDDGATVHVPLAVLPQLDPEVMAWTIPGWHQAKLEALLDGLPKATRKALAPVDELVTALATALRPFSGPMVRQVCEAVFDRRGVRLVPADLELRGLPPHLSLGFAVVDERDKVLGTGRDLAELQATFGHRARALWAAAPREKLERTGLTGWELDALPEVVTVDVGGRKLQAFPALVDRETAVDVVLLESAAAAREATRAGLRRLHLFGMSTTLSKLDGQLPAAIASGPLATGGGAVPPRRQLVLRALDEAFALAEPPPRSKAAFAERLAAGRTRLPEVLVGLGRQFVELSTELGKARSALAPLAGKPGLLRAVHDDVTGQLAHLAPPDLLVTATPARLVHVVRYLRGVQVRLQRLLVDPQKDQGKAVQVLPLWQAWSKRTAELRARGQTDAAVDDFGWQLEELRISVFAPELGTATPVSLPRLQERWTTLSR